MDNNQDARFVIGKDGEAPIELTSNLGLIKPPVDTGARIDTVDPTTIEKSPVVISEVDNRMFTPVHELKIPAEELRWRRLAAYALGAPYLYTDDGELQDATVFPHIDFLRDSAETVENKLIERTIRQLRAPLKKESLG